MPDQQITRAELDMAIRKGVDNLKDHIAGFEVGQDELHKRVKAIEMATEGAVPDPRYDIKYAKFSDIEATTISVMETYRAERVAVTDGLTKDIRQMVTIIEGLTERIAKVETSVDQFVKLSKNLGDGVARISADVKVFVKESQGVFDKAIADLSTRIGEGDRSRVGQDITSELSALADRIDAHERGVDEDDKGTAVDPDILDQMDQRLGSLHARVQDVYTKVGQLLLSTDSKFAVMHRDHEKHEGMSMVRHEEMLELIRVVQQNMASVDTWHHIELVKVIEAHKQSGEAKPMPDPEDEEQHCGLDQQVMVKGLENHIRGIVFAITPRPQTVLQFTKHAPGVVGGVPILDLHDEFDWLLAAVRRMEKKAREFKKEHTS